MLKKRKLGNQGLEVSEIGLGCMTMTQSYGVPNDEESIATIHKALELGVNFFDTAEAYGPYLNEELVARALKGKRDKVVIATKFGYNLTNGKFNPGMNSHPDHIRQAVEDSLKRLKTDHIDVLYQHRVDPNVPIEEVVGVMAEFVKAGKVRYLGLSEAGKETIEKAHKVHPISVLQSEYSIWERNLESEIIPFIRKLGIGLVAFSPIGRGFFSGETKRAEEYPEDDWRRDDPRMQGKNYDENQRIISELNKIAERKKVTASQIALSWILHKGDDIVPIPGTKKRTHLEEDVNAANVELSENDVKEIDRLFPIGKVAGPRYNEEQMSYIDR